MSVTFPDHTVGHGEPYRDEAVEWFLRGPATTDEFGQITDEASSALALTEAASPDDWPEAVRETALLLTQAGLWPGLDFVVEPYVGNPKTAEKNAGNAMRDGARGVELWNIAVSFAATAKTEGGEDRTVVMTGPGDLRFQTEDVVLGQVGELEPLDKERLEELGFGHGTVSPVGALLKDDDVTYFFDKDFVDRETRNPDEMVYISGGDTGWAIALDIRKLIARANQFAPAQAVSDICERGSETERLFARHDITLITGDSAQVGSRYQGYLEASVRGSLNEAGTYFGDRSMPNLSLFSDRAMGATGSIETYRQAVVETVARIVGNIPESRTRQLVAFTSNAANLSSVTELINAKIEDREDVELVTVQDALEEYIAQEEPELLVMFGLEGVVDEYPDEIGVLKL